MLRTTFLLVKKDLVQQRLFIVFALTFEVTSCEVLFAQMHQVSDALALMVFQLLAWVGGFLFCFRTVVSDEKNRAFLFLKSLPITNAEIAISKFATNGGLVLVNFVSMLGYLEIARGIGHVALGTRVSLPATLLLGATQLASNYFFLSIALLFDSEKAVWIPFPCLWGLAMLIGNARRIADAIGLAPAWSALGAHLGLLACIALAAAMGMALVTVALFTRRRRFG